MAAVFLFSNLNQIRFFSTSNLFPGRVVPSSHSLQKDQPLVVFLLGILCRLLWHRRYPWRRPCYWSRGHIWILVVDIAFSISCVLGMHVFSNDSCSTYSASIPLGNCTTYLGLSNSVILWVVPLRESSLLCFLSQTLPVRNSWFHVGEALWPKQIDQKYQNQGERLVCGCRTRVPIGFQYLCAHGRGTKSTVGPSHPPKTNLLLGKRTAESWYMHQSYHIQI